MKRLEGIVIAHVTPFEEGGQVDYPALERYTRFLIEKKVNGMFVCGTTAEAQILSLEERKKILETVLKANDGTMVITAQCGTSSLAETRALLDHARASGSDGAAVVTPFYYIYTQEELFDYYATLAREYSDFPLYLYNIPQLTNNHLAADTAARLTSQFPHLAGIKDSSGNFTVINDYLRTSHPDFRVIVGYDRALLSSLLLGGWGSVTGPGGVVPEPFVRVWQAYRDRNYEKALEYQKQVTTLSIALKEGTSFAVLKAALSLRGFGSPRMRKPFHSLPQEEIEALRERMKHALQETGYPVSDFIE